MEHSPLDNQILSLGWSDWILFAEVEQRLREAKSQNPQAEAIAWVVKFVQEGLVTAGHYDGRYIRWPESGKELELRMRQWLEHKPRDPLGPAMTLMFELTESGRNAVPNEQRF
ncbi:hypothetical protein AB0268_12990 [Pseudarthrobacter oxydans]|uniref:hypothetical protein n=1 Tax=Pseudarthrobacter oxydans TaxID=1671 RepID=UPI00344FAE01